MLVPSASGYQYQLPTSPDENERYSNHLWKPAMVGGAGRRREIEVPVERDLVTLSRETPWLWTEMLRPHSRAVTSFLTRLPFSDARLVPILEAPAVAYSYIILRKGLKLCRYVVYSQKLPRRVQAREVTCRISRSLARRRTRVGCTRPLRTSCAGLVPHSLPTPLLLALEPGCPRHASQRPRAAAAATAYLACYLQPHCLVLLAQCPTPCRYYCQRVSELQQLLLGNDISVKKQSECPGARLQHAYMPGKAEGIRHSQVLANTGVLLALGSGRLLQQVFFGPLQAREVEVRTTFVSRNAAKACCRGCTTRHGSSSRSPCWLSPYSVMTSTFPS